jgi:hypothetical protein
METKLVRSRGRVALVVQDPEKPPRERDVLAQMDSYADCGCWHVTDVRLAQYVQPSPYSGSVSAEHYHSDFLPESADEAALVRSLLREYQEDADGTVRWCTFEGIVRGQPEVAGYRPVTYAGFDQAGYFSQREALAKLVEIQKFWNSFEGNPATVKIENPNRQPTQSAVMFAVSDWKREQGTPHRPASLSM